MRNHRITHTAVVGVVVAALAAPGAAAQQDLRMPDTRDAAARFAQRTVTVPGFPVPTPPPDVRQDLRSPDTRDIAQGRGPSTAPDVTVIEVPQPAPAARGDRSGRRRHGSRIHARAGGRGNPRGSIPQAPAPADGDLGVIVMRSRIAIVAIATCTALLPAAAASAATVPIAGTIIPGPTGPVPHRPSKDRTCGGNAPARPRRTPETCRALRPRCSRSTATSTPGPASPGRAAYETFSGCLGDACGTLDWNWHVTFRTVPETLELLGGSGQARITGGAGALAGAKGSFRITCGRSRPAATRAT